MRKYILFLFLGLVSMKLEAQVLLHSSKFYHDKKYGNTNIFIYEPCNCQSELFLFPYFGNMWLENFPYIGSNFISNDVFFNHTSFLNLNHTYYEEYDIPFFNAYPSAFLPKDSIEYLSIETKPNDESIHLVFFVPDSASKQTNILVYNNTFIYRFQSRLFDNRVKLDYKYKEQTPQYFINCYDKLTNIGSKKNSYAVVDADCINTTLHTSEENDSLRLQWRTNINYFPKPYPKYKRLKHIDKLSPLISKSIKKYCNSKYISFEDVANVNDNKLLITNVLDSLGRVKKQSYTLGKDYWTTQIILMHNYGVDTDTVRQYACNPYKLKGLDTNLVMTAIYQKEKLISLHQNLLEKKINDYYYKNIYAGRILCYPILPIHNLTYRVFYNEAGDVEKIIAPNKGATRIFSEYSNAYLQPHDVCVLNFEYSDYDAKRNWRTATITGEKGKGQNEYCGFKQVFKREIVYKKE